MKTEQEYANRLEQVLKELEAEYGYTIAARIVVSNGIEDGKPYVRHTPVIMPVQTNEVLENASNSNMG